MKEHGRDQQTKVFICCGSSCKEGKAKKVRERLEEAIAERGLDEMLEVHPVSCLKQCKHGPVVALEKGGKCFDNVKPKRVDKVLDKIVKRCRSSS